MVSRRGVVRIGIYMKKDHKRKSSRLRGFDYGLAGAYFITINAYRGRCIFGTIDKGISYLSLLGEIVEYEWIQTGEIRSEIELDMYCVMPNHFHAIIWIKDGDRKIFTPHQGLPQPCIPPNQLGMQPRKLGNAINQFKGAVTREAKYLNYNTPIWHRRYHDRIIRDEKEYLAIRRYIETNPERW